MKTKNAKIDLTAFLVTERFPYSAELSLGDGQTLTVKVRASDPDRARAAILAAVGDDLTALGFEPSTLLAFTAGQVPKGQAKEDMKAAFDALDEDGEKRLAETLKRADGAGIADVIGDWSFDAEITPETCAALPSDVKPAILQVSAAGVVPVGKLDFLGK